MTIWSAEQDDCTSAINRWLKGPELVFRLWGDAGTGKTSLARRIADDFNGCVQAFAYTGKAASVLRRKGFEDAATFHSAMYIPAIQGRKRLEEHQAALGLAEKDREALDPSQADFALQQNLLKVEIDNLRTKIKEELLALKNPIFTLNTESPIIDLDFVIADEVSMLDAQVGGDLFTLCQKSGTKLLLMGDPNQLPPIRGTAYFMDKKPDFHLSGIHRQAADDPIIHLAQLAKNKQRLEPGQYGSSRVITKLQAQECLECDQLLVGKNNTRQYYNSRLRELRGYSQEMAINPDTKQEYRVDANVEINEKLICLRNSKQGFFNGSIWYVDDVYETTRDEKRVCLDLRPEDENEDTRQALVHCESLRGGEVHFMDAEGAQSMVSAQAITVHKFQGSQGKHIVVLDESFVSGANAHKWLYTGITRAEEKVTVVIND